MNPLLTLIPLSTVCGALSAWLFRALTGRGVRQTVNRILAHIMELRLYIDEPAVVLKAQRDLMRENIRLLGQIALPSVIAILLFGSLIWKLDAVYGRAPLPAGQPAVVTAHADTDLEMEAPPNVAIETPGVRIPAEHEVTWRIRPRLPFRGSLAVHTADGRRIDVQIPWPRASILGLDWLVWFIGVSFLAAPLAARVPTWIMTRRGATLVLAVALLAPATAAAANPTIILISIDTLRADHLSAYGYRKLATPNIDSFAAGGTIYKQIDSQIPLTLPSHTVLMTSSLPFATGVEANVQTVPSGAVTLAGILRANGYRTGAFIGSAILDRRYGLDQGFDTYDSPFQAAAGEAANPYSARIRRDGVLVIRAARQWMEKNRNQPLFVFLHLYDLHTPYPSPGMAGLKPNVAGYDAQLKHIDQALGSFRAQLMRDGAWDNSLVILLADHGESLGDHGETSHGYFIYESTLHVPLIIHWPTGAAAQPPSPQPPSMDRAAGLIDVAPTILDFLHIPAPPSFAGHSLLQTVANRDVFAESVYPRDTFGWAPLRSLREGSYKYIDAPRPEFYDLSRDPGETANVLKGHLREAGALKARLNALIAGSSPHKQNEPEISQKTRDLLGSLGYTAGGAARGSSGIDPKDRIAEQEGYENSLALLYTENFAAAIAGLRSVVAHDPRNLPALCAEAEAYKRSGNPARALTLWQQALDRNPNYRPAAESIGEYWLAQHDYAKACPLLPLAPECAGNRR